MLQRPCRCRRFGFFAVVILAVIFTGRMTSLAAPVSSGPATALGDLSPDANSPGQVVPLRSVLQQAPGAAWMRVRFERVAFPGFTTEGSGYLRITSTLDGAVQILSAVDYERWHHRSAYFNGDEIRIEAVGIAANGPVAIEIADVISGVADDSGAPGAPRTICGSNDDRVLSSDPRIARIVLAEGDFTSVCSCSIIGDANRCMLTSGGCAGALDEDTVIEFNAPLTYPNGSTLAHPSPEDQFVPDLASIQRQTGGNGNDWGYFGCFPNSTSGLTPFETQGDFFELAEEIPAPSNQVLRVFGNGLTNPPVFRTWSYVAKEATGPFAGQSGDALQVAADATNGDSGAAVTLDSSGAMIGVLTNDGCAEFVGANVATSVLNGNLRKALAQPMGVCIPITFNFINGLPEFVNPGGGDTLIVSVFGANGTTPEPDSGLFHYNDGSGWVTVPMNEISPDTYQATFAPTTCGNFIDYYVSVETSLGVRFPDQIANPVSTHRTVAATGITQLVSNDFEVGTGWTLQDVNVTAGGWERGVPDGDGNNNGPDADADGSGQCWATGLADNVDLDGGPTRLRSPSYDLSAANNPFLSFDAWFTTDDALADKLSLQYSDSGGLFWTTVAEIGNQGPGWFPARYRIADFGNLTSGVRFRFNVADLPNNSETEAGLDALTIIDYECGSSVTCTKGDFNDDTVRNGRDIAGFADALINAAMSGTVEFCAADMDDDGTLELGDDLQMFVQCVLLENCP